MRALKLYAKFFKRLKAYERICSDLKDQVLRELKHQPEGKAAVDGVELHVTTKRTPMFPEDIQEILNNLRAQIDEQKHVAEEAGKVTYKEKETFDAEIPKSAEKKILAGVPDYRKHFGVKQ